MDRLVVHASTLPGDWKWQALFSPVEGFERELRAWLAQAQLAEERALLAWWAHRSRPDGDRGDRGDDGGLAAAA